ncbi:MAG: GNAT family N-acetyltransferase [Bacteroidota bacterium]
MKLLEHQHINKKKWDKTLASSSFPFVYAASWYLDAVHPGWQAIADENYTCLFPVPVKKRSAITYAIKPFFTQQLGWFGNPTPAKEKETIALLEKNFRYIDFSIRTRPPVNEKKWQVKENINYELNLTPGYEKISKKYSENCRRNLKKSLKNGHSACEDLSMDEMIKLFKRTKGRELKEMTSAHYKIIRSVYEAAEKKNAAFITGIKNKNGKLISAVLFIHWENRIYHLFSASDEEGKRSGAAPAVIDHCIKKFAGTTTILDFEGSNVAGLARFYSGFGSERKMYYSMRYNNLPFFLKWLKK